VKTPTSLKRTLAATAFGLLVAQHVFAEGNTEEVPADMSAALEQSTAISNNSAFGGWIVNCEAITVNSTACRLIQQLSRTEDNSLIVRMIVLPAGDGTHLMIAQTPSGVYLPGGAVYRFAENEEIEQREMIWQNCMADTCEAAARLDADELAIFDVNTTLLFGYRPDVTSEAIIVPMDISQFGEAIAALNLSQQN
jgi:invasion protein IalB